MDNLNAFRIIVHYTDGKRPLTMPIGAIGKKMAQDSYARFVVEARQYNNVTRMELKQGRKTLQKSVFNRA